MNPCTLQRCQLQQPAGSTPPPSPYFQFAPYNTCYERLESHLDAVGCSRTINCWDQPLLLLSEHFQQQQQQGGAPGGSGAPVGGLTEALRSPEGGKGPAGSGGRNRGGPAFTILPPEKLMPFVVPFKVGGWAGIGVAMLFEPW